MADRTFLRPSGVSRRTVAKGAAWSVPSIALAAQASAAQTSVPQPEVRLTGTAYKLPGASCTKVDDALYQHGYRYYLSAKNPTDSLVGVVVTSVNVGNKPHPVYELWHSDNALATGFGDGRFAAAKSFPLPAKATLVLALDADGDNSANTLMSYTYSVYDVATGALLRADADSGTSFTTPPNKVCLPF